MRKETGQTECEQVKFNNTVDRVINKKRRVVKRKSTRIDRNLPKRGLEGKDQQLITGLPQEDIVITIRTYSARWESFDLPSFHTISLFEARWYY